MTTTRAARTVRERQILDGLMRGRSSTRIGQDLGLSRETIDNYVKGLLVRFRSRNRMEMVCKLWARECARLKRLTAATDDHRAA